MGLVPVSGESGAGAVDGLVVRAPLPGRVEPLTAVPDPVFAAGMVGPGLAVDPVVDPAGAPAVEGVGDREPGAGEVPVRAPIGGVLVKVHPHAFVVQGPDAVAVLVHLGIDTVRLAGRGFTPVLAEGAAVTAGDVVVRWDVARAAAAGHRVICPVVVLEADAARLVPLAPLGAPVAAGAALLAVRPG